MTAVTIPTYNEKDNVREMAQKVLANLPQDGIVIFGDDNSPDGTGAILDEIAAAEPRVKVLHRAAKEGLGRAYVALFAEALRLGADVVVQMDCDFSHDPADIPRLVAAGADLAIGSRYVKGGATTGWPLKRLAISRIGGLVVRIVTGMKVKDPTGGFKAWRRSALEAIDYASAASKGYSFQLETNYRAWRKRLTIAEVPITFAERRAGVSKITGSIAVESLKMVFKLRFGKSHG
ncbi:MAG: polyprenol monophosphomannose synthase [Kiritimatiellae bacterium]|nr:polyprenol monophosphomannose synthase [Kiritimatiellia bacterium]